MSNEYTTQPSSYYQQQQYNYYYPQNYQQQQSNTYAYSNQQYGQYSTPDSNYSNASYYPTQYNGAYQQSYHTNNNSYYSSTSPDTSDSNNSIAELADSGYTSTHYKSPQKLVTPKVEPGCMVIQQDSSNIEVNLSNASLWSKFDELTTEMIITKQGRRMFPTLQYEIDGLEPTKKYNVFVDIIQSEHTTMKFQAGKWVPSTTPANKNKSAGVYLHPESPNTGAFWMRNELIFGKIKLTNNKKNPDSHMLLNSMHKYVPRLHIVEVNDDSAVADNNKNVKTFVFNETKFIAVTAYQNTDVTQLKIDNNPFAKGFRDNTSREYESSVLTSASYYTPSTPVAYEGKMRASAFTSTPKIASNTNYYANSNCQNSSPIAYSQSTKPVYTHNYFESLPTQYVPYQSYSYVPTSTVFCDSTNSQASTKRTYQDSNDYYGHDNDCGQKRQRV